MSGFQGGVEGIENEIKRIGDLVNTFQHNPDNHLDQGLGIQKDVNIRIEEITSIQENNWSVFRHER